HQAQWRRHRNSERSRGTTRSRGRRARHLASLQRRPKRKAPLCSASLHHFEGVELRNEGSVALITYMRHDSVRVSADAIAQVRDHMGSAYGEKYLPQKPNFYKSKKDAQEAHEAIRPTDVARTPESVKPYLDESMFKLY